MNSKINIFITLSLLATLVCAVGLYRAAQIDREANSRLKFTAESKIVIERIFLIGDCYKVAYYSDNKELKFDIYSGKVFCDAPSDRPMWLDSKINVYYSGYRENTATIHIHDPKELNTLPYEYYQNKSLHAVDASVLE